ncbi:hypothetical protein [Streptomyces sp. NRRL F-2664]|uniref:hypothetical protein n=1 Tax=Streptomyces sp. NRRL F-2664 TaxID=1463842 RepID=UPI0004CA70FB|nr:hypothetical protein [Streptomyces sp. NRRL F-2664]
MDLDWQFTQAWPGDPTCGGYVPRVGEHVFCYRPSDGASRCGIVDDNRAGLFLTTCAGERVALTAERWAATATPACT